MFCIDCLVKYCVANGASWLLGLISGMTVRNYRGITSIQEVECWGGKLQPEVQLLSIRIFTVPDKTLLARLDLLNDACSTFGEYASCYLDSNNAQNSRLRVLVHDLGEGESKIYGCKTSTLDPKEDKYSSAVWSLAVYRNSEYTACLAITNIMKNECNTFGEYSFSAIDTTENRNTK